MAQCIETQLSPYIRSSKDSGASQKAKPTMEFGMRSDTGCVRKNNEDSLLVVPEMNLFVVADGMGGLASGEVASRLTVDTIFEHCSEADCNPSLALIGESIEGVSQMSNRLASSIRLANQVVHQEADKNSTQQRMGATVVAVRVIDERMSLAHVGDSRAYRLRDDRLEQLTQDHSLIAEQVRRGGMTEQEARNSSLQNILIRAIGIEPKVEVEISEELVIDGDTVLLCSDGLTHEISEAQIAMVLIEARHSQEAADRLVNLAIQAGGQDNITAIVGRKTSSAVAAFAHSGRLGKWFRGFKGQSRRGAR
jgi:serine/threonine protein phosphatase PrpC